MAKNVLFCENLSGKLVLLGKQAAVTTDELNESLSFDCCLHRLPVYDTIKLIKLNNKHNFKLNKNN